MTLPLKAKLKERITSKEQFDALILSIDPRNSSWIGQPEKRDPLNHREVVQERRDYGNVRNVLAKPGYRLEDCYTSDSGFFVLSPSMMDVAGRVADKYHSTRWWLAREHLRMRLELYEGTEAMGCMVYRFPELAIHLKSDDEDKTRVWYTPDPQAGERDAQVGTTLARLMRKLYPHISDDAIRDAETAHRSELSEEIEFIDGPGIAEAYVEGPSSCMSHRMAHWNLSVHPTEAYNAPGFALAVGRDRDGNINSRCLTWVNPDDPKDKRAVRTYGDGVLKRKLLRKGYRVAGLAGARIKRIQVEGPREPDRAVRCVAPYVDYPDGNYGEHQGRSLFLDGPDYLRIVSDQNSDATRLALREAGAFFNALAGQGGSVWINPHDDMSILSATCPISGKVFTPGSSMMKYLVNGEFRLLHPDVVAEYQETYKEAFANVVGDDISSVMVPPGTPTFMEPGDSSAYVDDDRTRKYCGFSPLDADLYPEGPKWAYHGNTSNVIKNVAERTTARVMKDDVVDLVFMDGGTPTKLRVHKSMVADKKAFVTIHRIDSRVPTLAAKDVPVVRTASGRNVVKDVHAVRATFDGQIDFERNLEHTNVMGASFWHRTEVALTYDDVQAKVREYLKDELESVIQLSCARSGFSLDDYKATIWFQIGCLLARHVGYLFSIAPNGSVTYATLPTYRSRGSHDEGSGARIREFIRATRMMNAGEVPVPEYISGIGQADSLEMQLRIKCVAPLLAELTENLGDAALRAKWDEMNAGRISLTAATARVAFSIA